MNRIGHRALAVIGLGLWAAGFVGLGSASLIARITLLAPLVIVPLLLDAVPAERRTVPAGGVVALLAATPLLAAFAIDPGPLAAGLSLPWLALTASIGIGAALRGLRQLPGILRPGKAGELGLLGAFGFLGVAGLFVVFGRLGFQPGGFSAEIILLTVVHFHFAGFGLLGVAALLSARRPRLAAPVLGLLVGIPVTALGFVVGSMALNAAGASITGLSGVGVALALLTDRSPRALPARLAWTLTGLMLLVSMPMGIAWSVAIALGTSFLDLDRMVRTHGELNALAVLLVALAAPRLEPR